MVGSSSNIPSIPCIFRNLLRWRVWQSGGIGNPTCVRTPEQRALQGSDDTLTQGFLPLGFRGRRLARAVVEPSELTGAVLCRGIGRLHAVADKTEHIGRTLG